MNSGSANSLASETELLGTSKVSVHGSSDAAHAEGVGGMSREEQAALQRKVIIVDNFYEQPHSVRELAMRSRYANIEATDYPGFASKLVLSTTSLKARFEALIGARIVMDHARFTWGGFRFVTADSGARAVVHADAAIDWAAMIYLTPDAPDSSGTGFYRHKATAFTGPPTDREARALGYADASEFDDRVIGQDKRNLTKWEMVHHVAPRFNRLVLFRGGEMYHAPMGGWGNDQHDARLAHIFFFNAVPWSGRVLAHSRTPSRSADAAAEGHGLRDLISASKVACGVVDDLAEYVLVPCTSTKLALVGAVGLIEAGVASGELFRTADELSSRGHGLECLVLAKLGPGRCILDHWVVDGWRLLREHGTRLDLRRAQLRGAQLLGAKLERCDLSEADLSGADLAKSSLQNARLNGALMAGVNLFSATLSGADLTEADLSRADLRHADLRAAMCARAAFRGADLWDAYTWNVDLSEAFTDGADFRRADNLTAVVKKAIEQPSA